MSPPAASIRLTAEERAKHLADFTAQHLEVQGYAATPYDTTKNRPTRMMSQVATGKEHIDKLKAAQDAKVAEEGAKQARKVQREANAEKKKEDDKIKAEERKKRDSDRAEKKKLVEAAKSAKVAEKAAAPKTVAAKPAPKRVRDAHEDTYTKKYAAKRPRSEK